MYRYADSILLQDGIKYRDIQEDSAKGKQYIEAIKEEALARLGYFLKPSELFSEVAKRKAVTRRGKTISFWKIWVKSDQHRTEYDGYSQ